ncbi:MAG TPA: hypothetical protein VM261_13465 [Kofleriaceae bacterium]|nr:hypothetical protein [Kofleriaceae bacterium]
MVRSPLYKDMSFSPSPRARVALEWNELSLYLPDGRWRQIELDGSSNEIGDATARRRFVRIMTIEWGYESASVITPPDHGAIAPRVAHLPVAPEDAAVVEAGVWETLVDWVSSSGRLAGRTVEELARLASIATAPFAVAIGEVAAQVARDLARLARGPLRGAADVIEWLRPLHLAARTSPRAEDALVAALAACTE